MLEFIFFNDDLRQRFVDFAAKLDLESESRIDQLGTVVMLPEELPEETVDQLEDEYAKLMDEQAALSDQADDSDQRHVAGIRITLSDGSERMIELDPEMMNRLLDAFTLEEIQAFISAIADGLQKSNDRTLCGR